MQKRKSKNLDLFDYFNMLLMLLFTLSFVIPFLHLIFASVSDPAYLSRTTGLILWPRGFTLKGYELSFSNRSIISGYLNTFFYLGLGTVLNMVCTMMAAYTLSRKKVMFNNAIMFVLVFTMFFNGGLIPFYLQVRNVGLYNNRMVMILPELISVMNVIIVRTAFAGIDENLYESAKIDGAGHFTILFKIIMPVSKATIAVITLFYAVHHWNAWFNASIFLQDRSKFPLQLIMREILILNEDNAKSESLIEAAANDKYRPLVKYAVIIISTVPILVVYPFIQKYFTKGVMIGSIKG
jgi:putative aldouronate transport system permease protein